MKTYVDNRPLKRFVKLSIVCLGIIILTVACKLDTKGDNGKEPNKAEAAGNLNYITYGNDVAFLKQHIDIIELSNSKENDRVLVSPALQGRVMTSSASGDDGRSYGWINRELFASGDTLEHINVYGGEERFWLGPEGGQYAIFFKKGTEFNLDNWYTPRLIDLEPFDVSQKSINAVTFIKSAKLINYSGFEFNVGIERKIELLSKKMIQDEFNLETLKHLKTVAYKTTNILTNTGEATWMKETGLLSIWLLGMFNPSANTTVVIPYKAGDERELGKIVNDTYFGKVPKDRLRASNGVVYFSGDGQYRSKIGLSPKRALDVLGAYDTQNHILTVLKYNRQHHTLDYVNSIWEIQEKPYAGDVINSYNDGAPEPGKPPLGPFYELETSSPALDLSPGESGTHIQITCHIEGGPTAIEPILLQLFGVSITDIKNAFTSIENN